MDEREQQRKVRHRLAMLRHAEEVSGNVAATCRYYGISRQTFYKWLRRYEELGEEGLRDRSSRPQHVSPPDQRRDRRQDHLPPSALPLRSAEDLDVPRRYHEVIVSPSGVWRILKRLDMNRLPASRRYKRHERRWKRYEKHSPATGSRST